MNFLAHAYLSGDDEKLVVGNFIADFVKGRNALQKFDQEIQRGILLHRAIDAFTDVHPIVSLSKNRLREKYRHYSGVIVDVFYDHFLAKNWSEFHRESLEDFATNIYSIIQDHRDVVPEAVKNFFPYMVRGNWLTGYQYVEGIHRALTGMSRRTPYVSRMEEASRDLEQHSQAFEYEFRLFFPQLKNHVSAFLKNTAPA